MTIIGQNDKLILDSTRIIKCGTCSNALSVQEAQDAEAVCPKCSSRICVYCGCSDAAACMHNSLPCEWKQAGMCDVCWFQIADLEYFSLLGEEEKVRPFVEPVRPSVVAV